jgi:M6 family metalloprotease-like protein
MHQKTRIQLVALATCAFVAVILAMPALPAGRSAIITETTPEKQAETTRVIKPAAATGTKTILVILLQFSGKSHQSANTPAFYTDLLFNIGNKQSMASYYKENSYGRLTLTGTVTAWLTSSHTMSYYGADSGDFPNIDDQNGNIFEIAREAVQKADPSVNYANFDLDSDGYVDNLIVIHAGEGQESSGSANDIWSHQWEIQPAETTSDAGKKAEHYALFAEDSPVGVIAHEFGHVLGLPDMYDYTYSGQVFVGPWALMDSGSWNGDPAGTRPSHMISWSKMRLGFINDSEVQDVGINEVKTVAIIPTHVQTLSSGSKRAAVINISAGIYYTVEVRNKTASTSNQFDQALPDSGVLVTFCNDSATEETFYGRPGVCVVQNAKPSDSSNDHAPFDLGAGEDSEFEDPARNVKVRIISKNASNGAYTVELSHMQLQIRWFYVNSTDTWRTYEGQTYDLTITLENTGSTTINPVSGLLIAPPSGATVLPVDTISYGPLGPNAISNGTGHFHVQNAGSITNTPLNFTLNMTFNAGSKASLKFQVPVHKENTPPVVSITTPASNTTECEASAPISLIASATDVGGGIFKVWYRYTSGAVISKWVEMAYGGSSAAAIATIQELGSATITVRVMDTSGNIDQDAVIVLIKDTTPPSLLLSVNGDTGPSHFTIIGEELSIVAVAIDNNEVATVEISINGGEWFSLLPYPATVDMGINGTLDGYAYPWAPNIEGNQLIKLRATDASGNDASVEWQLTTISPNTITTIIVVIAVIIIVFSVISSIARRRTRSYRTTRYRYRY